jgi:hypothetical protein
MQRKLWLALAVAGSLLWGCGEPTREVCDDNIDNDEDGVGDCADIIDCSAEPTCNPERLCADGVDNDEDGTQDCQDTDCATDPSCAEFNCGDNIDNDGDTLVDCNDSDCDANALCQADPEDCNVVGDEDGDGDADCADTDCAADPDCQGPEVCTNDIDDNANGDVDCADADCAADLGCAIEAGNCADGIDNDGNTFTDCDDFDCDGDAACPAEICDNGISDDGDNFIDCADRDCDVAANCIALENCTDTQDNDGDGAIDCADGSCVGNAACVGVPENSDALCSDGVSNDGDNFTDCADRDCDVATNCIALESCTDGQDNDNDFATDCADGSCVNNVACNAGAVQIQQIQNGSITSGNVTINDVFVTGIRGAVGANMNIYVQEPNGQGNGNTYPEFSAIQIFITGPTTANFADLTGLAIGDCISIQGTITEFRNVITEIVTPTAFTKSANAANCGAVPVPLVIPSAGATFNDIASDTDNNTGNGDQISANSEKFEDVLVTVQNIKVTVLEANNNTDFRAIDNVIAGSGNLLVTNFLFAFTAPSVNQVFTSVTGIYTEFASAAGAEIPFDNFRLQPRSAADIQ